MGIVSFGAPRELIENIRSTFHVDTFVETGTYQGSTTVWASEHFKRVFTIEGSPEFHHLAQETHGHHGNIEFLLGDSRTKLREVVTRLEDTPALFWLDAHWMPGSYGAGRECPLLEEIEIIYQSRAEHFLLIDDARLFLMPPPLPHRASDWPDISTILSALNKPPHATNYTAVYNDVIVSVPAFAREHMQTFLQAKATEILHAPSGPPVSPVIQFLRRIKHRAKKLVGRT